jgi:hypothetical protein
MKQMECYVYEKEEVLLQGRKHFDQELQAEMLGARGAVLGMNRLQIKAQIVPPTPQLKL